LVRNVGGNGRNEGCPDEGFCCFGLKCAKKSKNKLSNEKRWEFLVMGKHKQMGILRPKCWKMKKTMKSINMNRAEPMLGGIPLYIKNNSFRVGVLVREREIEGGFGEEGTRAQEETQ
jgi:hypothetical protein